MKDISILLVEDSEADQFLFKALVEEIYPEIHITQAYDGQQAQEILSKNDCNPDIIFLDINMPRMNGYEFLDNTQNTILEKDISVYMLTSSNQESDREKSLSYKCVKDFVEKPFEIKVLKNVLSQY